MIRLKDGDRVCIIGAGPAGSFSALQILDMAHQRGIELEVLLFEPRNFDQLGPGGCNHCAGVLSTSLLDGLASLGIELPERVVQARITSYTIHSSHPLTIERPDPSRHIVSVYRGGGPRLGKQSEARSFDGYMLQQAQQRGAVHIPHRVHSVQWGDRHEVRTAGERVQADLVILATGVNSRPPLDPAFGYRPPRTATMAQDEVMRPDSWPPETVVTYFQKPPGMIFGAMIPKGSYLNVSLLGDNLSRDAVSEFFEAHGLTSLFPAFLNSLCGCTPRIVTNPAPRVFGWRWAAVGDAAVTRLYKDGIGSAFQTSRALAESVMEGGVSSQAFAHGYMPAYRRLKADNRYGKLIFALWGQILKTPRLRDLWAKSLSSEDQRPLAGRVHSRIMWGMLSGDESYRDLLRLALSLESTRELAASAFRRGGRID